MSDDIVDRIDALVDWQLAKGEPDPEMQPVVLPSMREFLIEVWGDLPGDIIRDVTDMTEAVVRGVIGGVFHAVGLPIPEVRFE